MPPGKLIPANAPMAFLSDVHGNLPALEAVLAELERRMISSIFVAGDLLLGGDDPVGVYKRLSQ
ncbi:MAG: metallophosphatase family protein, partial [Sandaracinaceae bacterium]